MQGKYEQAVLAYDWAIYFHAENAQMLENKSAALGSLGRFEESLKALDAAEKLEPRRAKTLVNRAITHYKMGLKAIAHHELLEAARLDPLDQQAKDLLKVIR